MHENRYAFNAKHSPEIMAKWSRVNLSKQVFVGPAEVAIKLLDAMMSSTNWENLSPDHDAVTSYTRTAAHIACEMAQHFWNDCEQRGWLLPQTPEDEEPQEPAMVTGTSHIDMSDPLNPRSLSHEEFLAQQAGEHVEGSSSSISFNSGDDQEPLPVKPEE